MEGKVGVESKCYAGPQRNKENGDLGGGISTIHTTRVLARGTKYTL